MEHRAELLKFTIDLNQEGNLEFNLDCIDTREMEVVLHKLGSMEYSYRVAGIVRQYFRQLEERIAKEQT
jgi:hypothetical protein